MLFVTHSKNYNMVTAISFVRHPRQYSHNIVAVSLQPTTLITNSSGTNCPNVAVTTTSANRLYIGSSFNRYNSNSRWNVKRTFSALPVPPPTMENVPWIDTTSIPDRPMYKYWSDNTFVTSSSSSSSLSSDNSSTVCNPSTQELIAHVPETTKEECQMVIAKAKQAQYEWRTVPVQQRQRIMFHYQQLIRDHIDEIITTITLENGKTIVDAKGDIQRGLEVVETSCQLVTQLLGNTCMGISTSLDTISIRQPIGIGVGICPFNFPAMIPLWMFPIAITAGNSFILKPSHQTPSCALLLAQLTAEAGLPPNVLQVVHGTKPVVQQLITDPDIAAISFVGGDSAGTYIHETGIRHGKRVQANLGAKNHAIVLPDSDRDAVVRAIVGAAFGAAGQRCMALSVVVLVTDNNNKDDTELWCQDIVKAAQKLQVGAGWESTTDVGPVISIQAKDRIEKTISKSVMQGNAQLLLDGRGIQVPNYPKGNFIGPTIIRIQDASNRDTNVAYTEEIFGPVLTILSTNTLEDAMNIVNTNRYGNGVSLFTHSGAAARYFMNHIECGQIGINVPIPVPCPMGNGFSFTGNKGSICNGNYNLYGSSGVQFYTQIKTITSNWPYNPESSSSNKNKSVVDLGGVTMPTMDSTNTK